MTDLGEPWSCVYRPVAEWNRAVPPEEGDPDFGLDLSPSPERPFHIMSRLGYEPRAEVELVLSCGEVITTSGQTIIATINRHATSPPSAKGGHIVVAARITECVNSMHGIEEPSTWVDGVKRLLSRLHEEGDRTASELLNQSRR